MFEPKISSHKRLREANGTLALVGLALRVQRLFEATGTAKIFEIYPTEGEAAAKMKSIETAQGRLATMAVAGNRN